MERQSSSSGCAATENQGASCSPRPRPFGLPLNPGESDFSGYVAADEVYDGPFCMLSAADNRCDKRILYDVLDHDPTHDDIRAFLGRLKMALAARNLTLCGVTTDGSA